MLRRGPYLGRSKFWVQEVVRALGLDLLTLSSHIPYVTAVSGAPKRCKTRLSELGNDRATAINFRVKIMIPNDPYIAPMQSPDSPKGSRTFSQWGIVKIMVPFWVPIIIRGLIWGLI